MKRYISLTCILISIFVLLAKEQRLSMTLDRTIAIPKIQNFLNFAVSDSFLYLYESGNKVKQKSYCFNLNGTQITSFNVETESLYEPLLRMNYWFFNKQISLYDIRQYRVDFYNIYGKIIESKNNIKDNELFWDFSELDNEKYYLTWVLPSTKLEYVWNLYKEDENKNMTLLKSYKLPYEQLKDIPIKDIPNIERGLFIDSNKNKIMAISERVSEGYRVSVYKEKSMLSILISEVENKILQDIKIGDSFILMAFSKKNGKSFEYRIYDFTDNYKGNIKNTKNAPLKILGDQIYLLEQRKKQINVYSIQIKS